MSGSIRLYFVVVSLFAVEASAGQQDAQLQLGLDPLLPDWPNTQTATGVWDNFQATFDHTATDLIADRLHPFSVMNWSLQNPGDNSFTLQQRMTDTASRIVPNSLARAARQTAAELPVLLWLQDREGFMAEFLRDSLGSVEEESVTPLSLTYHPTERSWWNQLSEDSSLHYGIRPLRTDPYAFMSMAFRSGDNLLALAHLRYHFIGFSEHTFEFALSLPLASQVSAELGASYHFGHHEEEKHMTLKLCRSLASGSLMHVGLELQRRPVLFAGMSFSL